MEKLCRSILAILVPNRRRVWPSSDLPNECRGGMPFVGVPAFRICIHTGYFRDRLPGRWTPGSCVELPTASLHLPTARDDARCCWMQHLWKRGCGLKLPRVLARGLQNFKKRMRRWARLEVPALAAIFPMRTMSISPDPIHRPHPTKKPWRPRSRLKPGPNTPSAWSCFSSATLPGGRQ